MSTAFKAEIDTGGLLTWDEELRQRLLSFMARYNSDVDRWSYSAISRDMQRYFGKAQVKGKARNVGLGYTTIYNYAQGKSKSQEALERLETRLRAWLDHREHGGLVSRIDESVIAAKQIQNGLLDADRSHKFVVIVGPSGIGKSLVTRHFANARTRGGMVIVEAYDGMTPRAFLAEMCKSLGEIETGSVHHLIQRARATLVEKPRLIAIDEANFLTDRSVNNLVYIWNQNHMGIALLGTSELARVVQHSDLERVSSRLKVMITLNELSEQEIEKRLLEAFDPKDVTARVKELARSGSFGRYRDLDTLIETATDELDRNEGKSLEQIFERIYSRTQGKGRRAR